MTYVDAALTPLRKTGQIKIYGPTAFAGTRKAGRLAAECLDMLAADEPELARIRGGTVALIFQDPVSALNPVHRVGQQVAEALRLHRDLAGAAARAEARRLFELVGIPE